VDFVNPIYRQLAAALLSDLVIRRIKNYTDRRLFSRRKVSDVFPHSLYTVSHASPTCAILLKDKPLLTRATCRRQIITKMILQGRKQAVAVTVANMSSKTENHCKSKLLITSIPNWTSPCRASSVGCQRDATRSCCWARRPRLAIDICYRHPQGAGRPPATAAAVDRWDRRTDRQTDGRTHDCYIDPAPHTRRAALIR